MKKPPLSPEERSLRRARRVRRLLYALAIATSLIVLFYTVENLRGRRAWNNYRQTLVARGEPVYLADVVPPPVPDADNFAASPLFAEELSNPGAFDKRWPKFAGEANSRVRRGQLDDLIGAVTNLQAAAARMKLDLPEAAKTAPKNREDAGRVLVTLLEVYKEPLTELRAAANRPASRFNLQYDIANPIALPLPHLSALKSICQTLRLRTIGNLAAGDTAQAEADLLLGLRTADALRSEPFIISHLVRIAGFSIMLQALWEGLEQHRWNDAQLRHIETFLENIDLPQGLYTVIQGERASINTFFEALPKGQATTENDWDDGGSDPTRVAVRWMPRGWLLLEKVNYNKTMDQLLGTFDPKAAAAFSPTQSAALDKQVDQSLQKHPFRLFLGHRVFSSLLLPALGKMTFKTAYAETVIREARIACALERYRLAHGSFPDRLQDLVPQTIPSLPVDVVTGQPLIYRKRGDADYTLYSTGWNGKDDGGVSDKNMNNSPDWCWEEKIPEK